MKIQTFLSTAGAICLAVCTVAGSLHAADGAAADDATQNAGLEVTADNFTCLDDMTRVRHFFVDNLIGDLEGTLAAANSPTGATYPAGSVVQLVPSEVMVKHRAGYNAATRDWEFFELKVSEAGTVIDKRGFVDVVNRFGGNCFACHIKAESQWDMICEKGHGCEELTFTREQIAGVQAGDPRCK